VVAAAKETFPEIDAANTDEVLKDIFLANNQSHASNDNKTLMNQTKFTST